MALYRAAGAFRVSRFAKYSVLVAILLDVEPFFEVVPSLFKNALHLFLFVVFIRFVLPSFLFFDPSLLPLSASFFGLSFGMTELYFRRSHFRFLSQISKKAILVLLFVNFDLQKVERLRGDVSPPVGQKSALLFMRQMNKERRISKHAVSGYRPCFEGTTSHH